MSDNNHTYLTVDDRIEHTLLSKRQLMFFEAVDSASASDAIRKLWFLEHDAPGEPITFIINSPGGSVDAGFAVWDTAKLISSPITTLVTGLAASMGSLLSICADKGRRFATPNSRILIHQPSISGVVHGPAADLEIQANEIIRTRSRIAQIYSEATGQDPETIEAAIERDRWFSPEQAIDFGLLDKVITNSDELP